MAEKEFKVNEYITIKLEKKQTVIHVNKEPFIICKRLLLNIPETLLKDFDEINSIDAAAELYEETIMDGKIYNGVHGIKPLKIKFKISPEQEFWGSFLQCLYRY